MPSTSDQAAATASPGTAEDRIPAGDRAAVRPNTAGDHVTPASRRGGLTLADKVVERTAEQILKDLPGVGGTSGGFFGIGASSSLETRPSVAVTLSGRSCTIAVDIGLSYPTPIAEATERVRTTLSTEVARLTGVTVRQVDINVRWLRPATPGTDRGKRNLQ